MKYKIELPGQRAVSWNLMYSGINHWRRTDLKNEWTKIIHYACVANKIPRKHIQSPVAITIAVYMPRPYDVDNICAKLLIDGLKNYGILKDDSPKYVKWLHVYSESAKEYNLIIEIDDQV